MFSAFPLGNLTVALTVSYVGHLLQFVKLWSSLPSNRETNQQRNSHLCHAIIPVTELRQTEFILVTVVKEK